MAIKIASKNIYSIENPIIRNNIINTAKIDTTLIHPDIREYKKEVYHEYESVLSNEALIGDPEGDDFSLISDSTVQTSHVGVVSSSILYTVVACSFFDNYHKSNKISINIPKHHDNSYINKIYHLLDNNNNPEIKYSLYGNVYEGIVTGTVEVDKGLSSTPTVTHKGTFVYSNVKQTENDVLLQIPSNITRTEEYETLEMVEGETTKIVATSNANAFYQGAVFNTNFIDSPNNEDVFLLEFEILQTIRSNNLGGFKSFSLDSVGTGGGELEISGICQIFEATRAEITVYGDTIGISLEDGSITYGSGDNPYTLSGNELTQNDPTRLAENVLSQYSKGKETATILCDIGDYRNTEGYLSININPLKNVLLKYVLTLSDDYDTNYKVCVFEVVRGEVLENERLYNPFTYIAYSSAQVGMQVNLRVHKDDILYFEIGKNYEFERSAVLPMTFEVGNLVIPMISDVNLPHTDIPMSKKPDGTPKQFRIVGIDFIYDGAVWQKLSLQEI